MIEINDRFMAFAHLAKAKVGGPAITWPLNDYTPRPTDGESQPSASTLPAPKARPSSSMPNPQTSQSPNRSEEILSQKITEMHIDAC